MTDIQEEWKQIAAFPAYEISDLGRIRRASPGKRTEPGRILKTHPNKGYPRIGLRKNGKRFDVTIHRQVALAFLGPPPEGHEVNHKDCDTMNPAATNLEYLTKSENIRHAVRNGRLRPSHPNILSQHDVQCIRTNPNNLSGAQLAIMFSVSESMISRIRSGQRRSIS